jgi:uncharacterized protein YycO
VDKIKLRFVANKSFVSWVVRLFTRSPYSHVDYIFDNGKAYSSLPVVGVGYNRDRNDVNVYCEFEVKDKKTLESFLLSQMSKPYDWKAIFALPFIRNWQEDDAWFCSELIAAAISRANGESLFNEHLSRITPRDLFIHPGMKVINGI